MYTFLTILAIIVCLMLVLVVLVQNSKGGGFASGMGGVSNQIMGARKSADFLEKLTWGLAIGLLAICMIANFTITGTNEATKGSELNDKVEGYTPPSNNAPAPPAAPAPTN